MLDIGQQLVVHGFYKESLDILSYITEKDPYYVEATLLGAGIYDELGVCVTDGTLPDMVIDPSLNN